MKIYALTGGIGSGKSTVAKFFEKAGIPIISADALNAEAAKSEEIQKRIFDRFGTNDRMELRRIIFADAQAKKDMEAIMHPPVQDLFFRKFNALYDEGHDIVMYESALVFELGQRQTFEGVISVVCPEELRLARVVLRDNMNEEIARNIMKCQVDDEHRLTHSDYVIPSDCSLEALEAMAAQILTRIRLSH
jgi:dephospho-CoA kinase